MRFERFTVERFGRLRGLDSGERPLPGLVVVLGGNEAGKSTLFAFLSSMLYGFYPASRDGHPYTPWEGGDPEGTALLRMADGSLHEVHRRLLSAPRGQLLRDGRPEDLRNLTLPCAEHVPRGVFGEVFALTLAELGALEGESWALVQDRLLKAMGTTDLAPGREVVESLLREAGEIWRPNRRGSQRLRELRERLAELRALRGEARERDRTVRALADKLAAARGRLGDARREREEATDLARRSGGLAPIQAQLRRIRDLEDEAGPREELEGLPPDPETALREARERALVLAERLVELEEESRGPREKIERFGEQEEALVADEDEIRRLATRAAAVEPDRLRIGALEQEIRDFERRCQAQSRELFTVPWEEVDREGLRRIPTGEVRERIRRYASARDERRIAEETRRSQAWEAGRHSPVTNLWAGIGGLLASLLLLAAGLLGNQAIVFATGAAAAALGCALLARWWSLGHPLPGSEEARAAPPPPQASEARREEEEARRRVLELLRDLPLLDGFAAEPTADLAAGLERLQELLQDRADREASLHALRARVEACQRDLAEAGLRLGLELPGDSPGAVHVLERRLTDAVRAAEAARSARRDMERIERERERVQGELTEVREGQRELERRCRDLGGGDAEQGALRARLRIEAYRKAIRIWEELELSHPDLEEIQKRIAEAERRGEEWTEDEDAAVRARERVDELTREIEALEQQVGQWDRDLHHLQERETVDRVDGEIGSVQREMERLTFERDRKYVLARLLEEADRRFRDAHQPDVLRLAGRHLADITGERYDEVAVGDHAGGEIFFLRGPHARRALSVDEAISTGTREQLYLALRLAVVDHLDREGERLPLFLDEVLANWDRPRRERGLRLLARLSRERQVFVFTCHEDVARSLQDAGAHLLRLEAPTAAGDAGSRETDEERAADPPAGAAGTADPADRSGRAADPPARPRPATGVHPQTRLDLGTGEAPGERASPGTGTSPAP